MCSEIANSSAIRYFTCIRVPRPCLIYQRHVETTAIQDLGVPSSVVHIVAQFCHVGRESGSYATSKFLSMTSRRILRSIRQVSQEQSSSVDDIASLLSPCLYFLKVSNANAITKAMRQASRMQGRSCALCKGWRVPSHENLPLRTAWLRKSA